MGCQSAMIKSAGHVANDTDLGVSVIQSGLFLFCSLNVFLAAAALTSKPRKKVTQSAEYFIHCQVYIQGCCSGRRGNTQAYLTAMLPSKGKGTPAGSWDSLRPVLGQLQTSGRGWEVWSAEVPSTGLGCESCGQQQ